MKADIAAGVDHRWRGKQAQDRQGAHALAGSGFPYQGQGLTGLNLEREIADYRTQLVLMTEGDRE